MDTQSPSSITPFSDDGSCRYSAEEIKQRIEGRDWYHRIPLPHGLYTPGTLPHGDWHIDFYKVPARLDGLRVLDIGAWDGFWSFEALRRGAREVVAIDDFSDDLGSVGFKERYAWQNLDTIRDILEVPDDKLQRHELSVYDLTEEHFGRFDVVFFFGLLYHLRYPLYALDKASAVCDDAIFVESAVCDHYSPYNKTGYPGTQMIMEFYPTDEYSNNHSNWWAPTVATLCNMVKTAGFEEIRGFSMMDRPCEHNLARGFAQGFKKDSKLFVP